MRSTAGEFSPSSSPPASVVCSSVGTLAPSPVSWPWTPPRSDSATKLGRTATVLLWNRTSSRLSRLAASSAVSSPVGSPTSSVVVSVSSPVVSSPPLVSFSRLPPLLRVPLLSCMSVASSPVSVSVLPQPWFLSTSPSVLLVPSVVP